ncbi:hypothetical protein Q604_UNBc4C00230G0001, partial [human gut metagenome]
MNLNGQLSLYSFNLKVIGIFTLNNPPSNISGGGLGSGWARSKTAIASRSREKVPEEI